MKRENGIRGSALPSVGLAFLCPLRSEVKRFTAASRRLDAPRLDALDARNFEPAENLPGIAVAANAFSVLSPARGEGTLDHHFSNNATEKSFRRIATR
jgi:hypothetical protein